MHWFNSHIDWTMPSTTQVVVLACIAVVAVSVYFAVVAHTAWRRQRDWKSYWDYQDERIVLNTTLCDLDDLYSEMSEEDAWEAAKEDRDYMHSTGMTVAEMLAEAAQIAEEHGNKHRARRASTWTEGIDANADEKGYS